MNRHMLSGVFLKFLATSLLNKILSPVVPDIIGSFRVCLTAAGFLAFVFFITYTVVSILAWACARTACGQGATASGTLGIPRRLCATAMGIR